MGAAGRAGRPGRKRKAAMDVDGIVFLGLSLSVGAAEVSFNKSEQASELSAKKFDELRVVLYNPDGSGVYLPLEPRTSLLNHTTFDVLKNHTVLFIPGFTVTPTSEAVRNITAAFLLHHHKVNFVVLDWSAYNKWPYVRAVFNMVRVAVVLAAWLDALAGDGLGSDKIWLVGQSLGAHLAGNMGLNMHSKPARITGLDPAGPLFWTPLLPKLNRNQGQFVDVIHTDAGWLGLGVRDSVGHLDFYVNHGTRDQPGCSFTRCSHRRAMAYFTESVLNATAFPAVSCPSDKDFWQERCAPAHRPITYMGYAAAPSAPAGRYQLRTAAQTPFGLGAAGLEPLADDKAVPLDNSMWFWEEEYLSD